jgi:hypothetical protein
MKESRDNVTRHTPPADLPPRRWILIVQHHQRDLYRDLRQALAGTSVEVLYERRVGQRRRPAAGPTEERRRANRRRPQPSAVVYQDSVGAPKRESPPRRSIDRESVEVVRPRRRQSASV